MSTTKITGTGLGLPTANATPLGGPSNEWADLYLAEGGVIHFGDGQDILLTHNPDVGLFLKSIATTDNNPVILTLQTGETDMAADDVIGKIAFQAPDEGTGTDAILISAAIQARSEQDFSASVNKTSLDFMVGSSEAAATKMTLNSTGNLLISDGTSSLPSLTNTGDLNTGIYFPAADTVGIVAGGTEQFRFGSNPIPGGTKNLFHNGDFAVAQRSGSVTGIGAGAAAYKVFDGVINTGLTGDETGRYTMSQSATAPANTGHRQSMKVDITTADTSIAAGHWYYLEMRLEAQNVSHLLYGESGAKPLTVSFWTRSTTTGDYQFLLSQPDGGRAYSTGYTISSADTWEKKTLTIPGDTGGTINNDTGIGLILTFMLTGSSSSQGGTEDSWASVANNMYGAGQTLNLFSSTDNDWYMAGLQVEVGSVATDFAFEDLGTTLQKCHRYYVRWALAAEVALSGACRSTSTGIVGGLNFPCAMRAAPTMTWGTFNTIDSSAGGVDGTLSTNVAGTKGVTASVASASGLADGNGLYCELKTGQTLQASAEL